MLDGLTKEEMDHFLEENPMIIPLFEIDIISAIGLPPTEDVTEDSLPPYEPYPTTIVELRHARDALERELAISQRVKASTLESLNLGSDENPRMLKIANNLPTDERFALIGCLLTIRMYSHGSTLT